MLLHITPKLSCAQGCQNNDDRDPPAELEKRLRKPGNATSVIARVENKQLVLDLRTVLPSEESELASALSSALR